MARFSGDEFVIWECLLHCNSEEEREMLPYCIDAKVAATPYSPLASGRLVRSLSEKTKRLEEDQIAMWKYGASEEVDRPIIERVAELAKKRDLTMIQVALAWILQIHMW